MCFRLLDGVKQSQKGKINRQNTIPRLRLFYTYKLRAGKKNRCFSNDQKDDERTKTQVDGRDKTPLRLSIFSFSILCEKDGNLP
jgi:hypothetical protein